MQTNVGRSCKPVPGGPHKQNLRPRSWTQPWQVANPGHMSMIAGTAWVAAMRWLSSKGMGADREAEPTCTGYLACKQDGDEEGSRQHVRCGACCSAAEGTTSTAQR